MIRIDGQPILTAVEMRVAEEGAIAAGATVDSLMARAGTAVAEAVRRLASGSEVLVLCGPGNNGGDGYVAATELAAAGLPVRVTATGEPSTEAARTARARWTGPVETLADAEPAPVLLDALFGTGLTRPLDDTLIEALHRLIEDARLSIAVDLPSGVATDDGRCLSEGPMVDLVLALGAAKPSHVLYPAAGRCRQIRVLDIDVSVAGRTSVLDRPVLEAPGTEDHKFSRGMVAIVAGAMPGAAALAATAAAHVGAGYVLLLGSATDRLPHAIVRRRYSSDLLDDPRIGALIIGPGLGRNDRARERLDAAIATNLPLVIDGDALHLLDVKSLGDRSAPVILTPHAGEFAKLFGEGEGGKIDRTRAAACDSGATIVFKGADTVIASPDGDVAVAVGSAPWLSTAGTGDVLAGTIAGQMAGGRDAFASSSAGVWLHTEAARLLGPAFIADDLAAALSRAIAQCL